VLFDLYRFRPFEAHNNNNNNIGKMHSKEDVDKDIERITFDQNAKHYVYNPTSPAYIQNKTFYNQHHDCRDGPKRKYNDNVNGENVRKEKYNYHYYLLGRFVP